MLKRFTKSLDELEEAAEKVTDAAEVVTEAGEVLDNAAEVMDKVEEAVNETGEVFNNVAEVVNEVAEVVNDAAEVINDAAEVANDASEVLNDTVEMLNETEQFIEKIEAVEKDRKESQSSVAASAQSEAAAEDEVTVVVQEVSEVGAGTSGIEIIVQRPSISQEGAEAEEQEAGEEVVIEDVTEEVDEAVEDEVKNPVDEDTVSIFAGIGEDSKVEYEAGEKVSEFLLYKKVGEDEEDIVGNYQIVDQGVIVSKRNEDDISVLSFSVAEEGDTASLRSVTIANTEDKEEQEEEEEDGVDDDCDGDSVKTLTEGEEDNNKHLRADVTQGVIFTNGEAEEEIQVHPDDEEDQVEVDEFRSAAKPEEDRASVKSYSIHGDYILSLHQRVAKEAAEAPVPMPRSGSVRAKNTVSFSEEENIEPVSTEESVAELTNGVADEVSEPAVSSYEEDRSKLDFEAIVKERMNSYRAEKKKTNIEVLEDIARDEEDPDRPNISALLAWARASKDTSNTQTFVVRRQKREEALRQSVNVASGAFEVIIKEKEKVSQTEENGVTKIKTGTKTFEVEQKPSVFEVHLDIISFFVDIYYLTDDKVRKKSVIQPSTNVTKTWFQNAINQHEGVSNCNVINMDFTKTPSVDIITKYLVMTISNFNTQGDQNAVIEADVNGDIKTYSWVVKETPKSTGGTFDKDTFVITDLGMKFGRYEYLNACFRMRILSLVWPLYSSNEYAV